MAALILAIAALASTDVQAQLPAPKAGGPDGGPMSILVYADPSAMQASDGSLLDKQYEKELTDAGYKITQVNVSQSLTPDFLRHFGVVIVSGLPFAGQEYQVGGDRLVSLQDNLRMLTDYVAAGGGLVLIPAMSEFGEAYAETYNNFLRPFDARLLAQQLRHDESTRVGYASGVIDSSQPIGAGLKQLLYPTNVMRWDNAYSTTPIIAGNEWNMVARGQDGSGSHQAIDNSHVGPRLTDHRAIFAFRRYEKGYIALSAIHAYYTLSHAYWKEKNIGENDTGVIDGAVLRGTSSEGAENRKSDFGALLDQTYRLFAANSAAHGLGGGQATLAEQSKPGPLNGAIDWHTAEPLPTWRHRLITTTAGISPGLDPALLGETQYFKILIGPRTALSSGKGTVQQYREAAIKAGYSAIAFCETFEDIDPAAWDAYVGQCQAASDEHFACLPGFDIKDFQGGRYLVIAAQRFPDANWLSKDRKKLEATRMLSLGWYGHIASVHRCMTDNALNYKMYKQYQGITVYTYDGQGKLVDDSLQAYQWAVASDSNPIPIAAHELLDPSQVALAATSGYQQIMPAPTVTQAVHYFRFGFPHYFECPFRYFISEGPILDGWSIRNKDLGPSETGHDHFRLSIGVRSDNPISEVTLYDGFEVAGRWTPAAKEFRTDFDGPHDAQHEFLLVAADTAGKHVLSPGVRTVTNNWRLRCGDRQNWLGSFWIYTGWNLNHLPSFAMPLKEKEIEQVPIFDYPFFSNQVQIAEADLSHRYVNTYGQEVGGDAKATYAVCPSELIDASVRSVYFTPVKRPDFGVVLLELDLRLKQEVQPKLSSAVYPVITDVRENNKLLILPDKPAEPLAGTTNVDLPIGSYAGGFVPLTAGLRIAGSQIGFAAPAAETSSLPAGQQWKAQYLLLRTATYHWRNVQQAFPADPVAEKALAQMGFRGPTPYTFQLTRGKLDKLAYIADITADGGGVAGTCRNDRSEELLFNVPLRIAGLTGRSATALWRSDSPTLEYFDCYQQQGYVPLNADKTVDFYAGNVAITDPELFVSVVVWNDKEAWFRVNNPLDREVNTPFATPDAIRGFKSVKKNLVVPAGASIDVKSEEK